MSSPDYIPDLDDDAPSTGTYGDPEPEYQEVMVVPASDFGETDGGAYVFFRDNDKS